jgi:hypothetical protein
LNISENVAIQRNGKLGNSVFVFQLYELYRRKMISSELYTTARSKFYTDEALFTNYDMFFVAKKNRIPLVVPVNDYRYPPNSPKTLYGVEINFWQRDFEWKGNLNTRSQNHQSVSITTGFDLAVSRNLFQHLSDNLAYELLNTGVSRNCLEMTELFQMRVPIPVIKKLEVMNDNLFRRVTLTFRPEYAHSFDFDYFKRWIEFAAEPCRQAPWDTGVFRCIVPLFEKITLPIEILIVLMRLPNAPHYFLKYYHKRYALDKAQLEMLFLIPTIEERVVRRYWCNSDKVITEVMQNFLKSGVYICYD